MTFGIVSKVVELFLNVKKEKKEMFSKVYINFKNLCIFLSCGTLCLVFIF